MGVLTGQMEQSSAWGAFAKAGDLQKRILFTIIALVVFRFGTYIPLPGIDAAAIAEIFSNSAAGGLLGMFNTFTGGALSRMSILALNIGPYISASIAIQILALVLEPMKALRKEGEAGVRKLNQYTRYLTIILAILQGYALAVFLENSNVMFMNSAWLFHATTIVSCLGGTLFVMWLGEQITARGVGNGTSLIITIGIIAELPNALFRTFELGRAGELSQLTIFGLILMAFVLIYVVVMVERAQRRIVIQYPKGISAGGRAMAMKNSYFPLKINPTGVMPPIFALGFIQLPMIVINILSNSNVSWAQTAQVWMSRGGFLYMTIYALLIIAFTFFYTNLLFNPKETAENLKKNGGFIAGIRPGASTAEYLGYVTNRLLVFGALYLVAICVIPEILIAELSVPFVLGGTSLLILVTVIMETISQIQSHLIAHQYESLIRKAQLKGLYRR